MVGDDWQTIDKKAWREQMRTSSDRVCMVTANDGSLYLHALMSRLDKVIPEGFCKSSIANYLRTKGDAAHVCGRAL